MENGRKHGDVKLATNENREIYLVSKPNYHMTKWFSKNLLAIQIKKTKVLMNKPVCLSLSILDVTKIAIYELWYDYIKTKCGEKTKLCYMDTDSFTACIKADRRYLHRNCKQDLILQIAN